MAEEQAKYGAMPDQVSKTAQQSPGTKKVQTPEEKRKRMGIEGTKAKR